jgi:hypothetical protein
VSPGGTTNSIIMSRAPLPPAAAMLARMRRAWMTHAVLFRDVSHHAGLQGHDLRHEGLVSRPDGSQRRISMRT